MSADETVYVLPNSKGRKPVLHTDPECQALEGRRDPTPKSRAAFRGRRVCSRCRGEEIDTAATNPGRTREGTARDQRVLEALLSADGPLTRRDLEFEAHFTSGQVKRALDSLRERDVVEIAPNEDGDGRKTLYRVSSAPGDRAQVTPIQVIEFFVVGLLVVGATAAISAGVIIP